MNSKTRRYQARLEILQTISRDIRVIQLAIERLEEKFNKLWGKEKKEHERLK